MCEYCNDIICWAKPLYDRDDISIRLTAKSAKLSVFTTEWTSVSINYCPMCGRELKENV